jgi:hypothetical protein
LSELTENRWAVLSERGCEATGLTYAEARDLMRALVNERVSGLSVITDAAARRAGPLVNSQPRRPNLNGTKTKVKR